MKTLCKVSNIFSDVRCPVCGQGFLVYWTRVAKHHSEHRNALLQGLRNQHAGSTSAEAHPAAFHLPEAGAYVLNSEATTFAMPSLLGMYS